MSVGMWVMVGVVVFLAWMLSSAQARAAKAEGKLRALGFDPMAPLPESLQGRADAIAADAMMEEHGYSKEEAESVVG